MSAKELGRLELVREVAAKRMKVAQAAGRLGLSPRQIKRLVRAYRQAGAEGLVSRRRGKPSNHRFDEDFKAKVLARVREDYPDFGPTLAAEYLRAEGLSVSKETLRQWMHHAGLWQAKSARVKRSHPPRLRRPRLGELVQIDGSPHDWFEGRGPRCTLIAFIDDATSRVMYARFVPADSKSNGVETSQAYLAALHTYVEAYGCPAALYSDRHGIFTKHDPEDAEPTQFQRATAALGIETIQALTPQAKGRVERLFQTLQDRLVKALRLAGIGDMEAANAFLPGYLARHNARFTVAPRDPQDAHLPYTGSREALSRTCALHHRRQLSKDLVLSFQRQRYVVQTGGQPRYALRKQTVTVVVYPDRPIELVHGEEVLPYKVFDPEQHVPHPVDDKTLDARVDAILKARPARAKYRPAPNHPWRGAPPTPSNVSRLTTP
ncbi:ISNCY family transposase [Methylococcus geothermalis]|nr:ISNCY family transposase [Methylococcus geothermalis]